MFSGIGLSGDRRSFVPSSLTYMEEMDVVFFFFGFFLFGETSNKIRTVIKFLFR